LSGVPDCASGRSGAFGTADPVPAWPGVDVPTPLVRRARRAAFFMARRRAFLAALV